MSDAEGRRDTTQISEPDHRHQIKISARPGDEVADPHQPGGWDTGPAVRATGTESFSGTGPSSPRDTEHRIRPDLREEEVVKGSLPGDRFIRQPRQAGAFRRKGGGMLS